MFKVQFYNMAKKGPTSLKKRLVIEQQLLD